MTDIAEVVRDLRGLQAEKPLAAKELGIYEHARGLLIADLMVAFGVDEEAAAARIDQVPLEA